MERWQDYQYFLEQNIVSFLNIILWLVNVSHRTVETVTEAHPSEA